MSRPEPSPSSEPLRSAGGARSSRIARVVGLLLVLVSLSFVVERLVRNLDEFSKSTHQVEWGLLPLFVIAFTGSQLFISLAFFKLLSWQGGLRLEATTSHVLFGRAQITKYIPGNVFQYVARHLAFKKRGVSDGALVMATGYETLSFVMAAGIITLLGLPAYTNQSSVISPALAVLIGLGALLGLAILARHGPTLLSWAGRAPPSGARLGAGRVLTAVTLYASFIAFSGALATVFMWQLDPKLGLRLMVIPAYALAWLCGYVVPGASGGLGIREATLLVLLGDTPESLLTALLMRVVTTLGELIWFGVSSAIPIDAATPASG